VTDQPGRDAEQFVAQPGGVSSAVVVDAGEGLQVDREVAGQQSGPHPHRVDGRVTRGEPAQRRAELGLADALLDVGATAKPRLHVADRLAFVGSVEGGDVGDDERHRVGMGRGTFQRQGQLIRVDGAPAPRSGIGGDRLGVDAHPPDNRVGAGGPACGSVVHRGDLRTGHARGLGQASASMPV
jgi:hypothetical protein